MSYKLYEVLGIGKDASKEDIKRAYKTQAIKHHPDKNGDPEKFKEISNAYQILSDDEKRAQYDRFGDAGLDQMNGGSGGFETVDPRHIFEQFFGGGMGGGHAGFHFDIFQDMFGGGGPQRNSRIKRNDHMHTIRINLAEAYHGAQKNIRISLQKTCFKCKDTCNACQGKGMITDMRRMGFITQMMQRPCDVCRGAGMIIKGKEGCNECGGKGNYQTEEKVDIQIPRGVIN